MSEAVWKLVQRVEWDQAEGPYRGSAKDVADGFIHMSTTEQLTETAERHYRGCDDLLLIEVAVQELAEGLAWEPSRGGALFPHLYGPLPLSAVRSVRPLAVDAQGVMRFANGAVGWP
jgi:uncharacterized protein (DUF952 family)